MFLEVRQIESAVRSPDAFAPQRHILEEIRFQVAPLLAVLLEQLGAPGGQRSFLASMPR